MGALHRKTCFMDTNSACGKQFTCISVFMVFTQREVCNGTHKGMEEVHLSVWLCVLCLTKGHITCSNLLAFTPAVKLK